MTDAKHIDYDTWLSTLYDVSGLSVEEIQTWYDSYQYKGFDRRQIIKQLKDLVGDVKEVMQIILVCALRGPQRAAPTRLISGKTIDSYRIPASGMKGREGISCQRITAATADLAAFFLKKLNVPKRLNVACPAWLQFPSAGSIKMPDELRSQHVEFHQRFSAVIGGVFNDQIYQQMVTSAYLDENLGLFDEYQFQSPTVRLSTVVPSVSLHKPEVPKSSSSQSSSSSVPVKK